MCKTGTTPRDHFTYKTKKTLGVVTSQRQISELIFKFSCKYIYKYIYNCLTVIITTNVLPLF